MKNDYKYLVANPFGTFLCRCKTMGQVNKFVKKHIIQAKEGFRLIMHRELFPQDYQVRDLNEIPTFEEIA